MDLFPSADARREDSQESVAIMPSVFSHAVASLGISACFYRPGIPNRVWLAGAICSVIPDLDVIGFKVGVKYGDLWGHRGISHSLFFAALLAAVVSVLVSPGSILRLSRVLLFVYLFLATASHGLLDAFTNGGLGVAFFAPFDDTRYFFPWTPIRVSPIGVTRFFSARGLAVLRSELLWIWLPTAMLIALAWYLRPTVRSQAMAATNYPDSNA
jgi:inner membrane protein